MQSSPTEPYEYERRWLVSDTSVVTRHHPTLIAQAYLLIRDGWTIRVRRQFTVGPSRPMSAVGYNTLAIKGPRREARRLEIEEQISPERAKALFREADHRIFKSRYQLIEDGLTWDVDLFHLENEGLAIAECEMDTPVPEISPPDWCAEEVTDDERYDNESLAWNPYLRWL